MKTRKSMTFWRWDRWIHQIRVFGTLFPGVWALFHGESCLWAWLLASDRLWVYLVPVLVPAPAGACKHDLFFLSLYIEKGTSAVFKEQRWEENPTDGIRLMTALAYSLWKWWAANNVSAGKIPDLVLCEWVCVCEKPSEGAAETVWAVYTCTYLIKSWGGEKGRRKIGASWKWIQFGISK